MIGPRSGAAQRRRYASLVLSLSIIFIVPVVCLGHGAGCNTISGGTAIEATYDDGSPMAYCDVEVFRPGEPGEAFQVGITDPLGRFAFVADTTGTWMLTVDDGMGHLASCEILVGPDGVGIVSSDSPDRLQGVIVGVTLIFGLFGLAALLYSRGRHTSACI